MQHVWKKTAALVVSLALTVGCLPFDSGSRRLPEKSAITAEAATYDVTTEGAVWHIGDTITKQNTNQWGLMLSEGARSGSFWVMGTGNLVVELGTENSINLSGYTVTGDTTEWPSGVKVTRQILYNNKYVITVNFVYDKLDITPKLDIKDAVYGTELKPSVSGNQGSGTVTYYYNTANVATTDTSWTTTPPTDIGQYYVYAKIDAAKCFNEGKTAVTPFKILGKVSFNTNGHGTAPAAQNVAYNSKAAEPSAPDAGIDWVFGGWYTDQACNNVYDFNTPVTANNTVLYAKWTQAPYHITLEGEAANALTLNGTYASENDTVVINAKNGYNLTKRPVTDIDGVGVIKNGNSFSFSMPASDVTVSLHDHDYTYTADGNVLSAECKGYKCHLTDNKTSLTLKADSRNYNGKPYEATLIEGEDWIMPEGVTGTPVITYSPENPMMPGDYTASVTIGDYTLTKSFTINQLSPWKTLKVDLENGNDVKLTEDITAEPGDDMIYLNKSNADVTVDLNGHKIDGNSSVSYIFAEPTMRYSKKLSLKDSSAEKTGMLTGAKSYAIYSYGAVDISDCTITGNGGGVYCIYSSLTLSGRPVIYGNGSGEQEKNLLIDYCSPVNIGQLTDDTKIGITKSSLSEVSGDNPFKFATGSGIGDYYKYFSSDAGSFTHNGKTYEYGITANTEGDSLFLTSSYFREKYPVSFYGAGENPPMQEILEGETVSKPADPVREGYDFLYWERSGSGENGKAYDFNTPVTESLVLSAVWKQKTFTVTIDGAKQTVPYGQKAVKPADPVAPANSEKNTFAGWVVAESVSSSNADAQTVMYTKGNAYDFSKPVYTDLKIESTWTHVHKYQAVKVSTILGKEYEAYDRVMHISFCSCLDYRIEAHDFVNGKCSCGQVEHNDPVTINIYFYNENTLETKGPLVNKKNRGETCSVTIPTQYKFGSSYCIYEGCELQNKNSAKISMSSKNNLSITPYQDTDIFIKYGNAITKPTVTLKSDYKKNSDNTLQYTIDWRIPKDWKIVSSGIKVADNNRMRAWYNNYNGMRQPAVYTFNLMKYYSYWDMMTHMIENKGLSAHKDGYTFKADVLSVDCPNPPGEGSFFVNYTISDKGAWQYVMAYVEVRDPSNNCFLYYTDPAAMRYKEKSECQVTVKSVADHCAQYYH